MRAPSTTVLLGLGIAAAIGYAAVARSVSRQRTAAEDKKLRDEVQNARDPKGESIAEVVHPIGKQWIHIPLAACLTGYLLHRGTGRAAVVPLVASIGSDTLSRVFDGLPPNRKPPPGHPNQAKPSFPSGHANETAAVAFTSAYVLSREAVVAAPPAFAVAAILAFASPASRMYLDRHWASDVIGGWCLGLATAAGCAAIYETMATQST